MGHISWLPGDSALGKAQDIKEQCVVNGYDGGLVMRRDNCRRTSTARRLL